MLIRRRKSRRSRPPRGGFSWRALVFEVFVVVLGVTLALGANELRQRFLDQRTVRVALEGIASEMERNCDQFTRVQVYHERVLAELDSVQAADPARLQEAGYLSTLPSWNGYNPAFVTSSAYETAQATGALALMPYERALGLGRYNRLLDMYVETVRQALSTVIQSGAPTVAQTESALRITVEFERELGPQSCKGAQQLRGEPTESVSDSTASAS